MHEIPARDKKHEMQLQLTNKRRNQNYSIEEVRSQEMSGRRMMKEEEPFIIRLHSFQREPNQTKAWGGLKKKLEARSREGLKAVRRNASKNYFALKAGFSTKFVGYGMWMVQDVVHSFIPATTFGVCQIDKLFVGPNYERFLFLIWSGWGLEGRRPRGEPQAIIACFGCCG
ncbi:uncharacterized protein LOC111454348 [Cucurbita moschata]|uniref:Uncharacterized protein LOC111454348 n=1 Tax=Cucurbita moschata TaxID=3662 RepID=A0A6J1GI29_CUCMO|nr:uncharacterized protein LOC111454348 [Cucurbita moschata]